MVSARALIALIRDIDKGVDAPSDTQNYVEIVRWNVDGQGGGDGDDEATALVRTLLRERLGMYELADIGAALLSEIDGVQEAGGE